MRIRKRFPPPSAPSDLHLSRSAAAQPKSEAAQTTGISPGQLSGEVVMAISDCNTRWARPENDNNGMKMKLKESGDDETWKEEHKKKLSCDDIRANNYIPSEEECTNNTFVQPSSSFSSAAKGDTKSLFPLKKRRGCFERSPKEETQMSARMKSKTNKKCDSSTQTDQEVAQNMNHGSSGTGAKKSKRGNVIMEGSRCSRVNGRGWRCCQPTLVGYALCEHHLGKGRVRSMSSTARQRHEDDEGHRRGGAQTSSNGDLGMQQPLVVTKRRTKVGVVKARSISSLLSQV